jgi:AcrR family transcriptional regulator
MSSGIKPFTREGSVSANDDAEAVRDRIVTAAFRLLMERGYTGTSTLQIATAAKVSKRAIYQLFGNKRGILRHMVTMGAARMQLPLTLPSPPRDRVALQATMISYGATLLRELSSPVVVAFYRLAASEADTSTEVAQALDTAGREANRAALAALLRHAQADAMIGPGDPSAMAGQYFALLLSDLPLRLLLRLATPPSAAEAEARAGAATAALLALYPPAAPSRES